MKLAVIAHNIRSVHNVGSIFRTADAAGVTKIFLCGITPAPLDRFKQVRVDFAKVALGAERYIPWESAPTTTGVVRQLKKEGYEIFALEQSKRSVPYYQEAAHLARAARKNADARVAVILGNEVKGLPPSVLRAADRILEIPMMGKKESLNVAVAFGIVVFGLRFGNGAGDSAKGAGDAII
ncbi:MAG: TrmH family RNA methyltransferase [Minisyncoccia bacterium]|jgi:tRNA G18 (ribose-2'-O)-methylase SpoU